MATYNAGSSLSPTQFTLLLHSVPHLGEKTLIRMLHVNATQRISPDACLALSPDEWHILYDPDPRSIDYVCQNRQTLLAKSAALARELRLQGVHVLTTESATYPERLTARADVPPPILYAHGNTALLAPPTPDRFTFTIAVSNGATPAALTRLDTLATALVQAGGVPVTGHDRTPYKRLALAAQRLNRPTLYVLDRGLREAMGPDLDRPLFAAARIREALFEAGRDLACSPFRLDDHAIGANNRRRDSLLFALSDLIIAGDVKAGGTMATECQNAHEQRRPVYIAPEGRDGNDALLALGCRLLPTDADWAKQVAATILG